MRGKISLILVLILLLSSCSSNQTSIEEEANEVENINTDYDSDEECFLRVLEPISSNLHPDKPVSSFLSMSFII